MHSVILVKVHEYILGTTYNFYRFGTPPRYTIDSM